MVKKLQAILLLIIVLTLESCAIPGSYMGPLDVRTPLMAEGKLANPEFIQVNPDLLRNDKSLNPPYQYKVGKRDVMNVIVWNHPELTIPSNQTTSDAVSVTTATNTLNENQVGILVDDKGEVFFPLVGKIKVENLSVDQVRIVMTNRMAKYIRSPQISVRVSVFRSKPIYVIGEVNKPGIQYANDIPRTVMDAINIAGGITTDSSDVGHVYIIRGSYEHPRVYWFNVTTPGAMMMAESFQLNPYDVVYISTAGITRWNRVVSQIVPTLSSVWYTKALINA